MVLANDGEKEDGRKPKRTGKEHWECSLLEIGKFNVFNGGSLSRI